MTTEATHSVPALTRSWGWWFALLHKTVAVGAILVFVAVSPAWSYSASRFNLERPMLSFGDRLEAHLCHQDGSNYVELAREGYKKDTLFCAFYPLWPALMRLGSYLAGGNLLWAGFVLSNLLSLGAAWLFYDWVRRQHGERMARWSLLFFLVMPGAAFFFLTYTESLFLFLVMLCFRWLLAGRVWSAAVVAFFLPLARPVGIFILAPLFWELVRQKRRRVDYFCLALPLAGFGAYLGIMYAFTGNPWEGFAAQRFFPNVASLSNMFNFKAMSEAFFNATEFHGVTASMVDRALFVGYLLSLPFLWRLNPTYF